MTCWPGAERGERSGSDEHYLRADLDVTIPPHLLAIQDGINDTWRRLALIAHGYASDRRTVRVGSAEGCQPPLLHTYRREDGERCQCGEREWPAELRDEEPSARPDG